MIQETELKLLVSKEFADFLGQEMANFTILSQNKQFLANCYYDTQDGFFTKNDMALRVREHKENKKYVLTLKSDANAFGGLHIRPEFNVSLASPEPDLSPLMEVYPIENWESLKLEPIFTTNFERQTWHIEFAYGVEIEVALDRGSIVAGDKSEPICEVEFELKAGDVEDLLYFVGTLTLESGIRLCSVSKAERGYRLLNNSKTEAKNWMEQWKALLDFTAQNEDSREKLTALFKFEQELIEETVQLGQDYFAQDFTQTVERIGSFFNLYYFYQENAKLIEDSMSIQLASGQSNLDKELRQEVLDSNSRLTAEVKDIIRLHSETKDNHAAMNKLIELLHTALYVKRMINLLLLTIKESAH